MKKRKRWIILNRLNKAVSKWALMLAAGVVLFLSMFSNVRPAKLDLSLFSVAEQTIRSPITIEDEEMTEKKRNEAKGQVQAQYVLKQEYAQNRVDLISSIFDSAIDVIEEVDKLRDEHKDQGEKDQDQQPFREPSVTEKVEMLKENLTADVIADLSESTLSALVSNSKNNLTIAKDAAVTAVNNAMTKRIPAGQVENAKKQAEEEIRYISLPQNLKEATIELGRYAIIQNEFYDPEATEELREQAIENVDPVMILQGQIIVEQGQLISKEIYRQLGLLGLLESKTPPQPFIGLILLVFILTGIIHFIFSKEDKEKTNRDLFIFVLILAVSVLLMKAISYLKFSPIDLSFIYPAAMSAILTKVLINDRSAFVSTVILSVCGTIIFNGQTSGTFHLTAGLYILISGIAGIIFLTNQNQRSKVFHAGLFVSLVNMLFIAATLFIPNSKFTYLQFALYFLTGAISGVASAVLSIGLIPFFEAGFGILSTMKLIELSNPNYPLLKKILTEAPGTYHHSIMVANLADSACEAIGANGLIARVGSYYHDIGKTKRPAYFVENQLNVDNPHDRLSPEVSRNIIISHTTDGAQILEKHHMPKEIVDIALQHHGTSLLKFFYSKAKDQGMDINEEDYRYPGPKPQTKEAAIVHIADSVEAAVRSMNNPSMEQIEEVVKNIIKDQINDQQFSECDISFKELSTVEKTICEALHGIFHNRIKYPELNDEGENDDTRN